MKKLILSAVLTLNCYANIENLQYFEADFTQNITDDNNKTIKYEGHIKAAKPQYALWEYKTPINKQVYILPTQVVVIEPDLEQAIVKKLSRSFDIFTLIKKAKKVDKNTLVATFQNTTYTIKLNKDVIETISYVDEFENNVKIDFRNESENKKIPLTAFEPKIPEDYDLIKE